MSILVQNQGTGEYLLMCKGADSTMMDLCTMTPTDRKASDKSLLDLACLGLRTLCISQKKLTQKDAQTWLERYRAASTALQNRAEQMAQVTPTTYLLTHAFTTHALNRVVQIAP